MNTTGYHPALIRRGNNLRIGEVPTTAPGAQGILVALSFVGICGTDLQILNGSRPDTAEILGHEGIGVVVRTGEGASVRVGEHVVFNPAAQLSSGQILGHNVPGLFQRNIVVDLRAIDEGLVLQTKDGDDVPPIYGALVEPLGAVIYAHELISRWVANVREVVVFGAGPVGILAATYLNGINAKALLVHPSATRLNTGIDLKLMNASTTLTGPENLTERILARNGGNRFDAAVICTTRLGAPAALRHAVEVVKNGGCIDLVANYPEAAPAPEKIATDEIRAVRAANVCGMPESGRYVVAEFSGSRRIALTGHRGTSRNHLTQAIKELRSKHAIYARLITHVLSLDEAAEAIQTLASSTDRSLNGRDCIKAVIDMARPLTS